MAVVACSNKNKINVLQPSGYIIEGKKIRRKNKQYVKITGVVMTDNVIRNLKF